MYRVDLADGTALVAPHCAPPFTIWTPAMEKIEPILDNIEPVLQHIDSDDDDDWKHEVTNDMEVESDMDVEVRRVIELANEDATTNWRNAIEWKQQQLGLIEPPSYQNKDTIVLRAKQKSQTQQNNYMV
jgi:hypothetical protein